MTKVNIYSTDNRYFHIDVSGHSGYAEAGEDIVCAGISVLVTTFENSLDQLTDDKYSVSATEDGDAVIDIIIEGIPSDESQLLFKSLIIGLELIKEEYDDYISLDYKEV